MKQMNTVKTTIYGTIHMDSDRDKGYIKYSSFLVREGYLMLYEDLMTLFQAARKKKVEAAGNI